MHTGVSYFSSRDLRHVRSDLREMADLGCDYVVHCYTETDLAYYRDTMRSITESTHDAGLEVWFDPWGFAGIFSGETFTRFPLEHPETWQVLSDGRRVPATCPNHPATRDFLRKWIDTCAAAGGDVLFWDEPHFYTGVWNRDFSGAIACYCDLCAADFRERYGHAQPREFTPEIKRWREATMLNLLTELCRHGHAQGLRNALCLFPTDLVGHGFPNPVDRLKEAFAGAPQPEPVGGQSGGSNDSPTAPADDTTRAEGALHIGIGDFDTAAAIPDLDIFGTDPYWFLLGVDPEAFMRTYSEEASASARKHNREFQLWLQAFRLPAGREEELRMGVQVAEDVGATHLAAWAFRATEPMSQLACGNSERVWEIVGEEFRRVSAGAEAG